MKAFRFRLDVLNKVLERDLEEQITKLEELRAKKNRLLSQIENIEIQLHESLEFKSISVHQLTSHYNYKQQLEHAKFKLEEQLEFLEDDETKILAEVVKIKNKLNVLEKLKKKSLEAYQKQFSLEEQKFLDELSNRGANRS